MTNKVTLTAPERIWLQVSDDEVDLQEPFPKPSDDCFVTWCRDSALNCEVEYVRADLVRAALRNERRKFEYEPRP